MHITSDLYERKPHRNQTHHDAYLLQHKGICPAILADSLDVTERFVIIRQRKLGIRKLTGNLPKGARYVAL